MNAEAEKIVRTALRAARNLQTDPAARRCRRPQPQKNPARARTGSAPGPGLEHPMVQQAQKLFNAEIQTVIDLRDGE